MSKEKAPAATAAVAAAAPEAEELPKTIVRRVVKEKLSEISTDGGDVTLHKEALIAFSESARIFIHYLSATAHDICSDSNRQIINADDVLNALEEVEFSEFIEPLRASLNGKKTAVKRAGSAKAKEENKKRKADEETATENGKAGETVVENGDDEETAVENGEDEEAVVENGKDEDNEDEDEDEEEASENKDDSNDS